MQQQMANSIVTLIEQGHIEAAKSLAAQLQNKKTEVEESKDYVTEFKMYMQEKELSKNTQRNYLDALDDYLESYKVFTKDNLIEWKQKLIDTRAPKTASSRVIAMNQFIKHILKDDELLLKKVNLVKKSHVENVITIEEFNKLSEYLLSIKNYRTYWIIQFLGRTGARIGELVRFRKTDLEQGFVELMTKGKIRVIHIPKKLIDESADFFETVNGDFLFPSLRNLGNHITGRGISEQIKRYGKKCEIREEVLHAHSFRHLFAIEFLKRNHDISLLADLMGHSSVATTQIYTRLSKEEQQKQLNETIDW